MLVSLADRPHQLMRVLHPVQSVVAVEVEGMNDSGVESVLLHLLVGHLALHLTLDPPLLEDHQVPHPMASAQVIHSQ